MQTPVLFLDLAQTKSSLQGVLLSQALSEISPVKSVKACDNNTPCRDDFVTGFK